MPNWCPTCSATERRSLDGTVPWRTLAPPDIARTDAKPASPQRPSNDGDGLERLSGWSWLDAIRKKGQQWARAGQRP